MLGGEVWKKLLNFNALRQGVKGSRRDDGIVCGEGGGDSIGVHRLFQTSTHPSVR